MKFWTRWAASAVLLLGNVLSAQVFGPFLHRDGDVDSTSIRTLVDTVCRKANARTERERVEAIWRFFLTDGRFVKPGFWYHIAYWAYEEPTGQVLDVTKLLNSYGFGLCYQIAPLLQSAWNAAGFRSRVWFLTGHTVAEVFYDGAYHYYDSDMLGYTPTGDDGYLKSPVASVGQLEKDPGIILRKLETPTKAKEGSVPFPWYPADLREKAMGGLAELFSSTNDNWLFSAQRYVDSHRMNFELRPGETMTLFYSPETSRSYYLPFETDDKAWKEVPVAVPAYKIRTEDGPKSEKDARRWGTGKIEFAPDLEDRSLYYGRPGFNEGLVFSGDTSGSLIRANGKASAVFEVASPWVIFDATIAMRAALPGSGDRVVVETSVDEGRSWRESSAVSGPHEGMWTAKPATVADSSHGKLTAVSGQYRYLVRLRLEGKATVGQLKISTDVQLNPRSLPELAAGKNTLQFAAQPAVRHAELPFEVPRFDSFSTSTANLRYLAEGGNGLLVPIAAKDAAEFVTEVSAPDGSPLRSFTAGGRFLRIEGGRAPDKFTAEVRQTAWKADPAVVPAGSIEWATSPKGPFQKIWQFDPVVKQQAGGERERLLEWPEAERSVNVPDGVKKVYVRFRIRNLALDSVRQSVDWNAKTEPTQLEVLHRWTEGGQSREHREQIGSGVASKSYTVEVGPGATNESITYSARRGQQGR